LIFVNPVQLLSIVVTMAMSLYAYV